MVLYVFFVCGATFTVKCPAVEDVFNEAESEESEWDNKHEPVGLDVGKSIDDECGSDKGV